MKKEQTIVIAYEFLEFNMTLDVSGKPILLNRLHTSGSTHF